MKRSLFSNPLVRLEFLRRFRTGGAAWGIPLLTVVPGLAVTIAYAASTRSFDAVMMGMNGFNGNEMQGLDGVSVSQVSDTGAPMFIALVAAVVMTLLVLIPAVVGGTIANERNNQTLQPLQLTSLTPTDILIGKLVSSTAYLFLLILCLAPVVAVPFLVGGVSLSNLLVVYLVLAMICVELAAVALAVSALLSKPVVSIVSSLIATGILVIGPWVVMGLAFWAQAAEGKVIAKDSVYRLLACPSPVALFSLVGDVGETSAGDFAGTAGVVGSIVCWGVVTVLALIVARSRLRAPVERDR